MLVSVIIPTYNRAYCIERALRSVCAQTHTALEIIVVDDGSTDGTRSIIERIAVDDERIQYIYQENAGVASARNTGLKHANGEFVALLDSDDIWKPYKIELQLSAFHTLPHLVMNWTDMEAINESGKLVTSRYLGTMYDNYKNYPLRRLFNKSKKLSDITNKFSEVTDGHCIYWGNIFSAMVRGNLVHTSTVMFRRSLLDTLGGFNTDLVKTGEDFDFHLRTAMQGDVALLDIATIVYQTGRADQLTHPSLVMQMAVNYIATIEPVIAHHRELIDLDDQMIKSTLSSAYVWYGSELFRSAAYQKARKAFVSAFRYKKSLNSLMYIAICAFPGKFIDKSLMIYHKIKSLKK